MDDRMKQVLIGESMLVLATEFENCPHTSLMAYVYDDSCCSIFMVTHKNTKKYRNIKHNERVSLLVDTRMTSCGNGVERSAIKAITVYGTAQIVEDSLREAEIRERFLLKHGHLVDFANNNEAVFVSVTLHSLQLLTGVSDSVYVELSPTESGVENRDGAI